MASKIRVFLKWQEQILADGNSLNSSYRNAFLLPLLVRCHFPGLHIGSKFLETNKDLI